MEHGGLFIEDCLSICCYTQQLVVLDLNKPLILCFKLWHLIHSAPLVDDSL